MASGQSFMIKEQANRVDLYLGPYIRDVRSAIKNFLIKEEFDYRELLERNRLDFAEGKKCDPEMVDAFREYADAFRWNTILGSKDIMKVKHIDESKPSNIEDFLHYYLMQTILLESHLLAKEESGGGRWKKEVGISTEYCHWAAYLADHDRMKDKYAKSKLLRKLTHRYMYNSNFIERGLKKDRKKEENPKLSWKYPLRYALMTTIFLENVQKIDDRGKRLFYKALNKMDDTLDITWEKLKNKKASIESVKKQTNIGYSVVQLAKDIAERMYALGIDRRSFFRIDKKVNQLESYVKGAYVKMRGIQKNKIYPPLRVIGSKGIN